MEWQRITDRRIRLVNTYGPSEATVVVATFEPRPNWTPTTEIMPIGLPIRNTRMLVVDQAGELVPLGLPGELVIEGAPVGAGHIGRTGRRSGFAGTGDGSARRYYTGDLARVLVDGIHEYLGRLDDQVKVSGIRIEPGEIEAALRTHQAVSDAVVLGVEDGGSTGLVAHVLSPAPVDEKAIQSHLLERLPPTMIPGSMVTHSAFPMTTSGKVDRVALSEHAPHRSDEPEARGAERPLTITEQRLNRVWRAVLPQASLRLDDDFFAIGGHSLLGVRLISRAAEEFGVELPLRVIYEAPTVATMASWIDDLLDGLPPESATSHRGDVDHGTT
ncbi:MAG: non-ribosomal peptide synthetase [Actinomycetota bacterium]|nr:non-ribosomal peptide synthetase [Actinomycetota bacterium]